VIEPGGLTPRPLFVGPPPRMRLFAERADEFFLKDLDAEGQFPARRLGPSDSTRLAAKRA